MNEEHLKQWLERKLRASFNLSDGDTLRIEIASSTADGTGFLSDSYRLRLHSNAKVPEHVFVKVRKKRQLNDNLSYRPQTQKNFARGMLRTLRRLFDWRTTPSASFTRSSKTYLGKLPMSVEISSVYLQNFQDISNREQSRRGTILRRWTQRRFGHAMP